MNRRDTVLALLALGVASLESKAQQPAKIPRIGFLGAGSASDSYSVSRLAAFRAGLSELRYVEGKNIRIEPRWADGKYEKLLELAAELVGLNVDVLVTGGIPAALAAKKSTTKIPIVMAIAGDAVATGLVDSLARPGGNLTGFTYFNPELAAKRLELLLEVLPGIKTVAMLDNSANPMTPRRIQTMKGTAKSLRIGLRLFDVRRPAEFERAFAGMTKMRADAVAISDDAMLVVHAQALADLAARRRLPSIGFSEFAESGGLLAYGVNFLEFYRRSAVFVDKILKGATPAELPIEQASRFEFLLNLRTAKALGVVISRDLLLRADRVIE